MELRPVTASTSADVNRAEMRTRRKQESTGRGYVKGPETVSTGAKAPRSTRDVGTDAYVVPAHSFQREVCFCKALCVGAVVDAAKLRRALGPAAHTQQGKQ